jgi:hypothetical protein
MNRMWPFCPRPDVGGIDSGNAEGSADGGCAFGGKALESSLPKPVVPQTNPPRTTLLQ